MGSLQPLRCIHQNTGKIQEPAARIALFWERRRVPWPRISGSSGDSEQVRLRDSVRARLLSGELFRLRSSRVWGGWANGTNACVVCKNSLQPQELEYELIDIPAGLSAIFVHPRCLTLWTTESQSLPPAA